MVTISSRYREVSLYISMRSYRLDVCYSDIKSLSLQYKKNSAMSKAHFTPMEIPTIC